MSQPTNDIGTALANIDARIADLTAQLAADTTTDGESVALGSYLTQLVGARAQLLEQASKYRKPFRVNVSHHP